MATFIYDGGCGFCLACVRWLKRQHVPSTIAFHPYQSSPPQMALAGLSPVDCLQAAYLVDECSGSSPRVYKGAAAVTFALRALPGLGAIGWRFLGGLYCLPGISRIADLAYVWVARHRGYISDGRPSCSIPGRSA